MKMTPGKGPRYWLNLLAFTVALLVVLWAGAIIWFTDARTLAYIHPPRQAASGQLLAENGIKCSEVTLHTCDGLRLRAWYTPPRNGAVILVAHGHTGTIPEDYYIMFAQHGYGVLAWDFRAHGKSEGQDSTLGYREALDIKAALDFALAQPGVEHVGAWGESMGAAAVIHAAALYPQIEAIVSDSAYSTLEEVVDMRTPWPILRPLVHFFGWKETGVQVAWMSPVADIARISPRPVFVIQGLDDRAIPRDSAQRLYQASGEPRSLWTEAGVGHIQMYPRFGELYARRVLAFFDEALLAR